MNPPTTVRVKISSEGTEMAITPVVSQDMPFHELLLRILAITGKDLSRITEILQRGGVVCGASRLRWNPITMDEAVLRDGLAQFPNSDPSRPFDPSRCLEIVLVERRRRVPIDIGAARKRRLFQSVSFWDALLKIAPQPVYREYSYKESADVYVATLSEGQHEAIQSALRLLTFPVRLTAIDSIAFHVPRA